MSYRDDVKHAVADPDWQAYRLSLKGKPTSCKLYWLSIYLNYGMTTENETELRRIRVDNYLKALARGGLVRLNGPFVTNFSHVEIIKE